MSSQSVLVIGGGLAGLSSAVALAEAGLSVRLLEKRPHLGGRATSYTLPDGSEVHNCQHVTLGCCTNLADFYSRVGASDKIRFYDRLYFADAQGQRSTIEAAPLPPPLHMAPSFLLFRALTPRAIPIWMQLPCSPCVNAYNNRQSACRDNVCMKSITVDHVFNVACQAYLDRQKEKESVAPARS